MFKFSSLLFWAVVHAFLPGSLSHQSHEPCPQPFVQVGNQCLAYFSDGATWDRARCKCWSLQGDLAVIHDVKGTAEWLNSIGGKQWTHVGANNRGHMGYHTWLNGTVIDNGDGGPQHWFKQAFEPIGIGKRDNLCVHIIYKPGNPGLGPEDWGYIANNFCDFEKPYICERK